MSIVYYLATWQENGKPVSSYFGAHDLWTWAHYFRTNYPWRSISVEWTEITIDTRSRVR